MVTILARRELKYVDEHDALHIIPVTLFTPEAGSLNGSCRFDIEWPDGLESQTIYGLDEMQALMLAMQNIGFRVYMSDYHKTGRLYFDEPGKGYGFPMHKTCRDMLIGDDARFEG